jgi:hypothetical protein
MQFGMQQRQLLKNSVILKTLLGTGTSACSIYANLFEKWLQLKFKRSYLFPKLWFYLIIKFVPTCELQTQWFDDMLVNLIQRIISIAQQHLLLEFIGCRFRLKITYSCLIAFKPVINILISATSKNYYYISMPVWYTPRPIQLQQRLKAELKL